MSEWKKVKLGDVEAMLRKPFESVCAKRPNDFGSSAKLLVGLSAFARMASRERGFAGIEVSKLSISSYLKRHERHCHDSWFLPQPG